MAAENIHVGRIVFLEKFISEIILGMYKEELSIKKVVIEKLRKKLGIDDSSEVEDAFQKILKGPLVTPEPTEERKQSLHLAPVPRGDVRALGRPIFFPNQPKKPVRSEMPPQRSTQHPQMQPMQPPVPKPTDNLPPPRQSTKIKGVPPQFRVTKKESGYTQGSAMSKIQKILGDPYVENIECQGPGKNLLIKKQGKIAVSKITLTKEEINEIVEHFSQEARIPVVGGILKAAVDRVIISAVVSEYVGSRFIISKINPYAPAGAAYY